MELNLEVDIPHGSTRIDLAPLLIPIVRALISRKWADDAITNPTRGQIEEWIQSAFHDYANDMRVLRLRRQWVIDYLVRNGWKVWTNHTGLGIIEYKQEKEVMGHYQSHHRYYHLPVPADELSEERRMSYLVTGVRTLTEFECRPVEDILASIEACAPALDQLAIINAQQIRGEGPPGPSS